MTDLDRALHATLTRVADEDVHVEQLLAGARASGVRYRRRRRIGRGVGIGVGVGAAVLAVSVSVSAGVSRPAGPGPAVGSEPSVAASPSSAAAKTTLPAPPVVDGAATAAGSAAEIGRPMLLHLGLDRAPFPVGGAQYQQLIDERQELLIIDGTVDDRRELTVRVGATTKDWEPLSGRRKTVVVGGRAGTLAVEKAAKAEDSGMAGNGPRAKADGGDEQSAVLRWRTANGLWLQVAGARDAAEASTVAAGVRLDRTYRCGAPYRLRTLPAKMKPESCSVVFDGGSASSMLSVTDKMSNILLVTAAGLVTQPNEKLGGRSARVVQHGGDGGAAILEVTVDEGDGVLSLTASGHYDAATVRRIAGDCQWVGGPDPATWPTDPLGSGR